MRCLCRRCTRTKGIPPDVESALERQRATVDELTQMYSEERGRREELERALAEMQKRLKKYEPLDTLADEIGKKGGLPVQIAERFVAEWMYEEWDKAEYDEMEYEEEETPKKKRIGKNGRMVRNSAKQG